MIGDLTGESLILKLLRKILQLEAPFSLIGDIEETVKTAPIIKRGLTGPYSVKEVKT